MTAPTHYIEFPGSAREALTFFGEVSGAVVDLHTFEEFHRTDGPADAVAHGYLKDGPVQLSGADVAGGERPVRCEGLMLSLLGTGFPATLKKWLSKLAEGGQVVDDLQIRPWGDSDGQVIDRYGPHWLIWLQGSFRG